MIIMIIQNRDDHGRRQGMRLPKISVEEPRWAQFLVALLVFAPNFGAILTGRWAADTLAYQTALALAITAFIVSWLLTTLSAILAHPSRPRTKSLIAGDVAFASTMFGMVILVAYRDWALLAIMVGVAIAIVSICAITVDRRRASANNEDGSAGA
jgi:hypothetical protein